MNVTDIAEYIVVFVSELAHKLNMSEAQTYRYLRQHKAIDFIESQYDIAHTLSLNDMMDAVIAFCQRNGGTLK